jgi:hypothetical protein
MVVREGRCNPSEFRGPLSGRVDGRVDGHRYPASLRSRLAKYKAIEIVLISTSKIRLFRKPPHPQIPAD